MLKTCVRLFLALSPLCLTQQRVRLCELLIDTRCLCRLFGSEDVDLRPVLCPPPPSPPPPPIISSSPPPASDNTGARMWARYKQTRPDTYKSSQKYTPTRRDRGYSVDKFGRASRLNSYEGKQYTQCCTYSLLERLSKLIIYCSDYILFIYWSIKTFKLNLSFILIFFFL